MDFRLADTAYTGFIPKTASEAIIKFRRLQATGISPFQYPEAFCECAKKLNDEEAGKFENWLICPQGEPDFSDCLPVEVFSKENLKVHNQLVLESKCAMAPVLQRQDCDDEKSAA